MRASWKVTTTTITQTTRREISQTPPSRFGRISPLPRQQFQVRTVQRSWKMLPARPDETRKQPLTRCRQCSNSSRSISIRRWPSMNRHLENLKLELLVIEEAEAA